MKNIVSIVHVSKINILIVNTVCDMKLPCEIHQNVPYFLKKTTEHFLNINV